MISSLKQSNEKTSKPFYSIYTIFTYENVQNNTGKKNSKKV